MYKLNAILFVIVRRGDRTAQLNQDRQQGRKHLGHSGKEMLHKTEEIHLASGNTQSIWRLLFVLVLMGMVVLVRLWSARIMHLV